MVLPRLVRVKYRKMTLGYVLIQIADYNLQLLSSGPTKIL